MNDELSGLRASVLHEPDNDTVRLVYADALEETGEPEHVARAELIRLQYGEATKCEKANS